MSFKPALGFMLIGSAVPLVAYSEIYMSEEQAAKSLFPGETFTKRTIKLSPDEIKKIEEQSGQKVRSDTLQAWVSSNKHIVFIDQVVGKHEFITYAAGVKADGKMQGLQILEYRESYGQGVKEDSWRNQFVGKTKDSPLQVGKDIHNLSGATLSSTHVTGGAKRILQTYESIRERL